MKIGEVLIKEGYIDNKQLKDCLKLQSEHPEKMLCEILIDNNMINQDQFKKVLAKYVNIIGIKLIQAGYINHDQLDRAIAIQNHHYEKQFGDILIEMDLITRKELDEILNTPFRPISFG